VLLLPEQVAPNAIGVCASSTLTVAPRRAPGRLYLSGAAPQSPDKRAGHQRELDAPVLSKGEDLG